MKKLNGFVVVLCLFFLFNTPSALQAETLPTDGRIIHIVCLKFNEQATPQQIEDVVREFRTLGGSLPQIAAFDGGANVSREKHNNGFSYCFSVTFNSAKDRDDYLVHPDHLALINRSKPVVSDVFVMDYVSTNKMPDQKPNKQDKS